MAREMIHPFSVLLTSKPLTQTAESLSCLNTDVL